MINGVIVQPLRVIPDERGRVMEILRRDDPVFHQFGQCYLTTTYPGVVKAWHCHHLQTDQICAVKGMLKLVMYDARPDSPTHGEVHELFIGEHQPTRVTIPPGVFHGWKCISTKEALVINCPSELYNYAQPDEHRLPWNSAEVPYDWAAKMG